MFRLAVLIVVLHFTKAQCPPGAIYSDLTNKCYQGISTPKSANLALIDCMQRDGNLVSIHSAFENFFIASQYAQNSSVWIGLVYSGTAYEWADETVMNYTNWFADCPTKHTQCCSSAPLNLPYARLIGMDYGPLWDNCISENVALPYVCEVPVTKTTTTTTPKPTVCPPDAIGHAGKCYLFENNTMKWSDARLACKSRNGDLVSLHNKDQNDWLASYADSLDMTLYWTGLNATMFTWSDGTTYDYSNYDDEGSGSCYQGPQDCMTVLSMNYMWYNCWPCTHKMQFVCEVQPLN